MRAARLVLQRLINENDPRLAAPGKLVGLAGEGLVALRMRSDALGALRDQLATLLDVVGLSGQALDEEILRRVGRLVQRSPEPAPKKTARGWRSATRIGDRPEIRIPAADPRATPKRPSDGPLTDTD